MRLYAPVLCRTVQISGRSADLYRPAGPVRAGIVFLHGGGFVEGSRAQFASICRHLCSRYPVICLSLDYRLAPAFAFPAPIQDAVAAFRWLMRTARLSADRVFLAGGSPGGCIAALAVLAAPRRQARWGVPPGPLPRRAILLNGICDLTAFYRQNPEEQARVHAFLGGDLTRMPLASPAAYSPSGRWLLLLHGSADQVVPPAQCRAFAGRLRRAGSQAKTVWFYNKPHAWFNGPGQAGPVADCIGRHLRQFLKE